ncbi:glyoxalase-like domain-containing protein [Cyathus striatus]|nr:glyoxalase-like domain-containing protein [Cyathus striatus]
MSTSVPSTKTLDHIVHLTPPGSVESVSKQFTDLGFTVIPGGTHADGLTANALVVLSDHIYLELISFTHSISHYPPGSPIRKQRESHAWANKEPGWIDFAFLGNGVAQPGTESQRISDAINNRGKEENTGVVYESEVPGGRTRPDGQILKWVITAVSKDLSKCKRGTWPFFCGDVTPRQLRVPTEPPANMRHPSTALGIAYIRVLSSSDALNQLAKELTSIVGAPPISSSDGEVVWKLDAVQAGTTPSPKLILSVPSTDDAEGVHYISNNLAGIHEVGFYVEDRQRNGRGNTPYGRLVWVYSGDD